MQEQLIAEYIAIECDATAQTGNLRASSKYVCLCSIYKHRRFEFEVSVLVQINNLWNCGLMKYIIYGAVYMGNSNTI